MRGVRKNFESTQALKGVEFSGRLGEVHAIVGENGAGKSTLMKILAGALQPDSGEILIDGVPVSIENPFSAHKLGIRAVYQEFSLVRNLSVTENILLGQMPTRQTGWIVNWADSHQLASKKLEELGFSGLDVRARVSNLSVSHQQMAEIAKAAITQPRIWILDEPSAVLSNEELKRLFTLIQKLKAESTLILYISHRLDEVFAIADRITVLKDGEFVGTVESNQTSENQLVKMMVGRTLGEFYPDRVNKPGEELLKVKNLTRAGHFSDISFSLKRGEILGFFGLVGSGRTQVARCIFGADKVSKGEIFLDGHAIKIRSPKEAVKKGIAFVTEDRKRDGLVMSCSIRDNASMAIWPGLSRWGILNSRGRDEKVKGQVRDLSVQPAEIRKLAKQLSGGNQQKVVLAKWLLSQARVLILDEPTRGVDVATKVEIYRIISDLAENGVGILLISSELPEILGMCDRTLVMRGGAIVGEFVAEKATEENLLACAAGVIHE
jgi:ABC-type sugar transport system ATPase subunit